jgi:hypothetical protein
MMERTIIRLSGIGGELDNISLPIDANEDAIKRVVLELVERCTLAVGDTITITEEWTDA